MNNSETVDAIANDYLERMKSLLHRLPPAEQDEFVKEIRSHIYESFQQTPGSDEVARILAVLRNLGEPAEVVSDRLPGAMMRAGVHRKLPLQVLSGAMIAIFGLPLGVGGAGVLMGLLAALCGLAMAFCALVGTVFVTGGLFLSLGLARIYSPGLWEKLVTLGVIRMDGPVGDFFDQMSAGAQGLSFLICAAVFIGAGLGMLKLGRYLLRGLRFLFNLVLDWLRQCTESIRRRQREQRKGLRAVFSGRRPENCV